eukprot:CAMPEP_0184697862 /NCGR_PEP_ID=MMETSP0313-20130426/4668_1 /TAXON_ID=2792 /ORGANISM="Porphyridium aerugineum, Strain SAG 1380-2" /LENGTH=176 /DNA_ID=CAMNT_0027156703 /DNA_START=121 /DNA_END=651 /DNA_ORIENTATION=-
MSADNTKAFSDYAKEGMLDEMMQLYQDSNFTINANWRNPEARERSALLRAAAWGHKETVEWLLENTNADIKLKDEDGMTALHLAAQSDRDKVIRVLINSGAGVNELSTQGDTPLILAAKFGCDTSLKVLMDLGADTKMKGSSGKSALEWATERDQGACVGTLISYKPVARSRSKKF